MTADSCDKFGPSRDSLVMRRGVLAPAVAGGVLLTIGLVSAFGWANWAEPLKWLRSHVGWLVLFGLAGGLLVTAVVRGVRQQPRRRRKETPAPPLSWWVVVAAAAVVGGVAWGATAWLLGEANQAKDPAAARVEAIKTGLSIGAGTGGVFALLLAVRRQWHQELTAAATDLDASEKRVTELYTKAADQLGSDKAPVRLAGLYALERVAQISPGQQQTIVNVLCAYLRMPYTSPGDEPAEDADQDVIKTYMEQVQEREVRLTAQRLLADHLSPGDGGVTAPAITYWAGISLDLTNATLINFSLAHCAVATVTFESATFTGRALFHSTRFMGAASFGSAKFNDVADFSLATFNDSAGFGLATFEGLAGFHSAGFMGVAGFGMVTFNAMADFSLATFNDPAGFALATFNDWAHFHSTRFMGAASFGSAKFNGVASFNAATFSQGTPYEVEQFMSPTSEGGDGDSPEASAGSVAGA